MSESQPEGQRGTGEEQDWRGEEEAMEGAPDIGTAGAFPALANESLPKDPDVLTDVDPGDERRWGDGDETGEPEAAQGSRAPDGDG